MKKYIGGNKERAGPLAPPTVAKATSISWLVLALRSDLQPEARAAASVSRRWLGTPTLVGLMSTATRALLGTARAGVPAALRDSAVRN